MLERTTEKVCVSVSGLSVEMSLLQRWDVPHSDVTEASSVRQSFAETVVPFLSSRRLFQTINDTRRQDQVALPVGERTCSNKTHR